MYIYVRNCTYMYIYVHMHIHLYTYIYFYIFILPPCMYTSRYTNKYCRKDSNSPSFEAQEPNMPSTFVWMFLEQEGLISAVCNRCYTID